MSNVQRSRKQIHKLVAAESWEIPEGSGTEQQYDNFLNRHNESEEK